MPVMRPTQNMREIIKQLVLLEDHLFQKTKRCPDCIRKHMAFTEGLAEECATLCAKEAAATANDAAHIAREVRVLHHAWEQAPNDDKVCTEVASRLRALRKSLMRAYAVLPLAKLPTSEQNDVKRVLQRARTRQ